MTNNVIRVAIAGATGRMGTAAVRAVSATDDLVIAGLLVREKRPDVEASLEPFGQAYDNAETLIATERPDVWLDLTTPESVVNHVDFALLSGVRPVVGATGYSQDDLERWNQIAAEREIGGLVCPNFAIGALLMMRFAAEAAKWMQKSEIIELHHDQKRDMPSGTAIRTKRMMDVDYDVPIHSVRLPGFVAHQEVIFGGTGEILTIRHDSLNRESFMPGVLTACRKVVQLRQVVYGLEHLLW
ncbi:4-hydroxy-tetrahydrodipicolinate reductase [Alicyclobacillus acidiphilus]|uniref:4-hydroxy-tetrahydrodipicolinate reductase n=1 Tax=Alicyclobacillus acidiphilus TaxID=182455 RepID=UPI000AF6160A|nr:4-hydroxy-tetrahydrodipicolinate reductase [Alicyclobacillus acidiphilus]